MVVSELDLVHHLLRGLAEGGKQGKDSLAVHDGEREMLAVLL